MYFILVSVPQEDKIVQKCWLIILNNKWNRIDYKKKFCVYVYVIVSLFWNTTSLQHIATKYFSTHILYLHSDADDIKEWILEKYLYVY